MLPLSITPLRITDISSPWWTPPTCRQTSEASWPKSPISSLENGDFGMTSTTHQDPPMTPSIYKQQSPPCSEKYMPTTCCVTCRRTRFIRGNSSHEECDKDSHGTTLGSVGGHPALSSHHQSTGQPAKGEQSKHPHKSLLTYTNLTQVMMVETEKYIAHIEQPDKDQNHLDMSSKHMQEVLADMPIILPKHGNTEKVIVFWWPIPMQLSSQITTTAFLS